MFPLSSPIEVFLLIAAIVAAVIFLCMPRAFKIVPKSHNKNNCDKTFYAQCSEFIGAIAKEESYYSLLRLGEKIEEYMSDQPVTSTNYGLRTKVYEALMKRKQFLSPRASNIKPFKLNVVGR